MILSVEFLSKRRFFITEQFNTEHDIEIVLNDITYYIDSISCPENRLMENKFFVRGDSQWDDFDRIIVTNKEKDIVLKLIDIINSGEMNGSYFTRIY